MAYYVAKVVLSIETDKGKTKKVSESYLVEAVSVTEAESIVYKDFEGDSTPFEVKSVTESRIIKVLPSILPRS